MPITGYGTNTGCKAFHVEYSLKQSTTGGLIDTAVTYENEKVITQGFGQSGKSREEMFLVTKIGPEHFDDIESAVMDHLAKFDTKTKQGKDVKIDHFDLVLLHWPHLYDPQNQRAPECAVKKNWGYCHQLAWAGLEKLVKRGVTRFIGVSNFAVKHLEPLWNWEDRKLPIYANQIEYHPFITPVWEETKRWSLRHGIRVMAFGSLGGLRREQAIEHPKIKKTAQELDITPEQVLFRWGIQQGVTVLQGSKRKRHIDAFMKLETTIKDWWVGSTASELMHGVGNRFGGDGHDLLGGEIENDWKMKCYQPDSSEEGPEKSEGGRSEL